MNWEALIWALVECPSEDLDVIDEEVVEGRNLVCAYFDAPLGKRLAIEMFADPDGGDRALVKEGDHGPDRELTNAILWWNKR